MKKSLPQQSLHREGLVSSVFMGQWTVLPVISATFPYFRRAKNPKLSRIPPLLQHLDVSNRSFRTRPCRCAQGHKQKWDIRSHKHRTSSEVWTQYLKEQVCVKVLCTISHVQQQGPEERWKSHDGNWKDTLTLSVRRATLPLQTNRPSSSVTREAVHCGTSLCTDPHALS